jgi:putative ATPase
MLAAAEDVQRHGALPVPLYLRNAPTSLMRNLGYGKDYKYAHDFDGQIVAQEHLPTELLGKRYYAPSDAGYEKEIKERLQFWQARKKEK